MISFNLNLINLILVCAKQNAAVMTVNDVCSMLAVQTRSDLVLQHTSSFIINFEQVHFESFFI